MCRGGEEGGQKRKVAAPAVGGGGGMALSVEGRKEGGERTAGALWLSLTPRDTSARQGWLSRCPRSEQPLQG